MTLLRRDIEYGSVEIPAEVVRFIAAAEHAIYDWLHHHRDRPVLGYVSSDFQQVYRCLAKLSQAQTRDDLHIERGASFCEWGSGFGVVADLAAWLDYESIGIEIEPELISAATELASAFGLPTHFACGSFIPDDEDAHRLTYGDYEWLDLSRGAAYDELEHAADEFDVIFVYPWPGEERIMRALFNHVARPGALFLMHHGMEGVHVYQKAHE